MKRILVTGIFLFPVILSLNCKNDDNSVNNSTYVSQIFPLSIGNQWIIEITNYDSLGNIVYVKNDTIKILRDTTIQSEKWFIGYGTMTNRYDGLYDFQKESPNQISLIYKYPAAASDVYIYRGTQIKVISIADSVSLLSGNYVCYHYRSGNEAVSYTDWYFAPNIGLVKKESYNPFSTGGTYKYLSYNLVKVNLK